MDATFYKRVQRETAQLKRFASDSANDSTPTSKIRIRVEPNIEDSSLQSTSPANTFHNIQSTYNTSDQLPSASEYIEIHPETQSTRIDVNLIALKNQLSFETDDNIEQALAYWKSHFNITRNAFESLLRILNSKIPNLSKCSKTIMKTPPAAVVEMNNGYYVHFGFDAGLKKYLNSLEIIPPEICLNCSTDGTSLYNGTKDELWPILSNIVGTNYVFTVGCFTGKEKPKNPDSFMEQFLKELHNLEQYGFDFNNVNIKIKPKAFVFDAPGRAFVLQIKYPTGFSCCTKCTVVGETIAKKKIILFYK